MVGIGYSGFSGIACSGLYKPLFCRFFLQCKKDITEKKALFSFDFFGPAKKMKAPLASEPYLIKNH
jgi:hypothetical protein